MALDRGAKLDLVVRPLSLVLQAIQLAIVIGLLATAILAAGGSVKLLDPLRSRQPWLFVAAIALGVLIVAAATAASLPTVRGVAGGIPSRCKRLIFLLCRGSTRLSSEASQLCRLVASDFRAVQLLHPSQREVIDKVYSHIKSADPSTPNYDAIVAPSGFGKTRCATLLAEALIRDTTLCSVADACLYYDFARGEDIQHLFGRRLGGLGHSGALVIVDNFHLALPRIVEETTARLLDLLQRPSERHVLLLAQPPGAWRLHGQGEVKLLTEARRRGRLHEIRGLTRREIDQAQLSSEALRRMPFLGPATASSLASIAEIHSVQIDRFAPPREREAAGRISSYLFPVEPEPPAWPSADPLPEVLGTATALALHRGAFSEQAFRQAYAAVIARRGPGAWPALWRASRWLHRLARIGLFPRTSLPGRLYVLHETLAEHLRDRLGLRDRRFEAAFRTALTWRLDVAPDGQSPALQWLGAAELRDVDRLTEHFDAAMVDGNLAAMARRLGANLEHFDGAAARYQLGVVLDKHGDFAEAREHLAAALVGGGEAMNEAAELALIEAAHGPDRMAAVTRLGASTRQEVRLAARYWRYHMDAHGGVFDPDGLTALAAQLTETFDASLFPSSFVLAQLASRVYFDACRHVFLRREDVAGRLQRLAALPVVHVLRSCDPSFRAANLLYGTAHKLAFVALSERAVFDRAPGAAELGEVAVDGGDLGSLCGQVEAAYRSAQDEYAVFGNREQLYLKADILNARLQNPGVDPKDVTLALSDYSDFIRRSGFADIASYPEAYGFRLAVKARQWALSATAAGASSGFDPVDEHDHQARLCLSRIRRMDEACGNRYGQWRGRFYETLFESISASSPARRAETIAALRRLRDEARRRGYIGDSIYIDRLLARDDLRLGQVFNALLFHPFVHQ